MDNIEKVVQSLASKVLSNMDKKLKREEVIAAFKKGMDNAIYNYPLKQYKPLSRYRRTGNLKKAVRFSRYLPGPANPNLRASVYLDDNILAKLYNPMSKNRGYGKYTAGGINTSGRANNTVLGLGWFPFSKKNIADFILKDIVKQGIA